MSLDIPALVGRAREGNKTALWQLAALRSQGVELPPAILPILAQYTSGLESKTELQEKPTVLEPSPEAWTQAEKDLQAGVVQYLQGMGWEVDQTFIGKTSRGKVFKTVGTPDLFAARAGHQVWIELKTATGKVSEAQQGWHQRFQAQGVTVLVCRSIYEVQEGLREAGML